MTKSFWATVTKKQRGKSHWLAVAAKAGVDVAAEFAPLYFDQVPKRASRETLTVDVFPALQTAVRTLREGDILVVANFGHFVTNAVWHWVAGKIKEKGAFVECAETGAVLDGGSVAVEDGYKLLKSRRIRTANEKRIAAGLPAGRPKPKLWHISYAEAVRRYGERETSVPAIAGAAGVSVMTVRRKVKELTGTDNKTVAVLMADKGEWPPKRKIRS